MKLISMLTHPGTRAEPRASLICHGQSYSRADAVTAVAHMAASLHDQGLRRGHRVLALVDHDAHGVFFLAAASAMGLRLLMPYNLQDGALPEWLNIVETARPDFVVDLKKGGNHAAALKALQDAGLVRTEIRGRHRWHELSPGPLALVQAWAADLATRHAEPQEKP